MKEQQLGALSSFHGCKARCLRSCVQARCKVDKREPRQGRWQRIWQWRERKTAKQEGITTDDQTNPDAPTEKGQKKGCVGEVERHQVAEGARDEGRNTRKGGGGKHLKSVRGAEKQKRRTVRENRGAQR
eukprot:2766677-Pleurochrysis_carterae.AAC.3